MQPVAQTTTDPIQGSDPVRLIFRFDRFEFSTLPLRLRFDGLVVEARPQSLRLLHLLLESIGEIVSTRQATRALWPNGGGNERVLRVTMAHLRAALDQDPEGPQFVETVRGLGYRFVHPVEITEENAGPSGAAAREALLVWRLMCKRDWRTVDWSHCPDQVEE